MTVLLVAAGCGDGAKTSLFDQIKVLGEEKTDLQLKVERLEIANKELTEQVETLTAIGSKARIDALERIERIELRKLTGLYDKDKDGSEETLIVYIRTIDEAGDLVKAAGSVKVQLWDLDAPNNPHLADWLVKPDELAKSWSPTMLTTYYRLKFDITGLLDDSKKELTVKVEFTDYVTGKVHRDQRVIKPK